MSTLSHSSRQRALSWRPPGSRDAWREWATRHSFALRLAAAGTSIGLAYHYSLLTLVRALGLDTPLAYLGLVPLMAVGIAWLRARPAEDDLDIHDRQVDVIVGVPLLLGAVLIVALLPSRLSSLFWVWRVDLLSLPLFVAGVITLVFGLRALWRLRVAVGFLLLAWPLPYTALLNRWLDGLTGLTVDALARVVQVWQVASPSPSGDGSLFRLVHDGQPFVLSVASSCSGVNGVVGFLLVGVGVATLVEGSRTAKALWLTVGVALVWALNVVRVLLIFWAGGAYGERAAVDGLHPVIGLVLFCAGIAVMAWVMPLFRLRMPAPRPRAATPSGASAAPTDRLPHHRVAVPRAKGALALLLVLTAFMGVANAGMRQYELVAGDLGAARLASFDAQPAVVPGFTTTTAASYPWASRFFGDDSSWTRYSYLARGARLNAPVTADVVSTTDLGRYNAYGIEACYKFHGYGVQGARAFDLGGGVTGNVLTYSNPRQGVTWDVVYWVWPVKTPQGDRYERVTLLLPSTAGEAAAQGGSVDPAAVSATPRTDPVRRLGTETLGTDRASTDTTSLDERRRFLVDFAKVIVTTRPGAA